MARTNRSKQQSEGLPKFDGREVDGARLAFSGSTDDASVLHLEDEVTMIVKGKVTGINHKPNQFGVLRRVHSIRVDHAVAADDVTAKKLQREIKAREDAERGQESLDGDIDQDGGS